MSKFLMEETGATAVEYALLAALIASVIVVAVAVLGRAVLGTFQDPVLLDAFS